MLPRPPMTDAPLTDLEPSTTRRRGLRGLPRWKLVLVFVAAACLIAGIALIPFESKRSLDGESPGIGALQTQGGAGGATLMPNEDGGPTPGEREMSPAFLKLGFSFFAAFAVGLAIRSFMRLALIFVGLQILALVGLTQLDWVTVHWEAISSAFDRFVANVEREAGSFQTLVTGSLPQAGLAGLGLFAGLRR